MILQPSGQPSGSADYVLQAFVDNTSSKLSLHYGQATTTTTSSFIHCMIGQCGMKPFAVARSNVEVGAGNYILTPTASHLSISTDLEGMFSQ